MNSPQVMLAEHAQDLADALVERRQHRQQCEAFLIGDVLREALGVPGRLHGRVVGVVGEAEGSRLPQRRRAVEARHGFARREKGEQF